MMEYIVLFRDSETWSAETLGGSNSVVVPESIVDREVWRSIFVEGEAEPNESIPSIPITDMIRELQDAGRWDKLTAAAIRRSKG